MPSSQPFLTQSDRIKALCDEAIKKPEITVTEKTLDAPVERSVSQEASRLKIAAMQQAVEAAAEAPAARAVVAEKSSAKPAPQVEQKHVETDLELAAMLEEREGKLRRRKKRVALVANALLLALVVTPVTVVAVNPTLRGKFETFVQHLGKGVDDVKTMANTKESFDQALKGVAKQGDYIDEASRAMGVDPDSLTEADDLEMTAEMTQFMGEDADGFAVRRGKLQSMGRVATAVTGMEETKIEKH